MQPKYIEKILLAAGIGVRCEKKNFVELGTYLGHSVRKITGLFEKTFTVEASENIFVAAKSLFELTDTPIESYLGSSLTLLEDLSPSDGDNAVIFLDAHYSTGITSRKYGECPIFEELDLILSKFPNSVCVIDDMRTMTGQDGYPSFRQIIDFLPSSIEVILKYDQMVLNLEQEKTHSIFWQ